MSVLLVTYDLKSPGQNYTPVHTYLKSMPGYCKHLESVWLIDTEKTTTQVRNDLMKLVDNNDVIFVVKITQSWASYNYGCADWLNNGSHTW
ncbi:hypothetical protein BRX43_13960 [Sphingomonas sp. S-NIH.Pt15_0812]|nr:hypothetical protein BRX43_13960 [Sphingomonas sp. S-NIH.Pt15_0812]